MPTVIRNFLVWIWSSMSYFLFQKERKVTIQCAEDVKISEQAAFLCQKYIESRFTRSDLCVYRPKKGTKDDRPAVTCSEDVVNTLCEIGALLEDTYPKLYNNVLQQLNFRINLGILACHMFNRVSERIIASGITWGRIVALYAFAGALAYDFTQAGDARFIRNVSGWMGCFTAKRLSPWIRQNGGWKGLVKHFKEEENSMMSSINRWLAQKGMTQSLGNGSDKNVRKFTFDAKSLPRADLF